MLSAELCGRQKLADSLLVGTFALSFNRETVYDEKHEQHETSRTRVEEGESDQREWHRKPPSRVLAVSSRLRHKVLLLCGGEMGADVSNLRRLKRRPSGLRDFHGVCLAGLTNITPD